MTDRDTKNAALLYGFHAVRQAWLNPERRCTRLLLTDNGEQLFTATLQEAERQGLTRRPQPQLVPREQLDRMLPGAVHQGIVLDARPLPETALEDVLRAADTRAAACVVVLDQVTDPHNVGAILRSAAAFGALAMILPDRSAPPAGGVLAKTASGAVEIVPIVRVTNLSRALEQLRKGGFWTIGFAESGRKPLAALDLSGKVALVLGAEGEGLRRLTMERCDLIARLPTNPPIGSLNVSNAAAIALYETCRAATASTGQAPGSDG